MQIHRKTSAKLRNSTADFQKNALEGNNDESVRKERAGFQPTANEARKGELNRVFHVFIDAINTTNKSPTKVFFLTKSVPRLATTVLPHSLLYFFCKYFIEVIANNAGLKTIILVEVLFYVVKGQPLYFYLRRPTHARLSSR